MLCPNPSVKAIFFDLDNVLVFSEFLHFSAWQKVLVFHGVDPNQIQFHDLIGKSDFLQAQLLSKRFAISDANTLYQQKKDFFLPLCQNGFEHPSGRNAFLAKLAQFYTVGLVSSSNNKVIHEVITLENIAQYFAFTIGFEDCQQHKPHPEPYLFALEKAKVHPHEALVIEDSVSGILAAQAAKIPVVGIFKDQTPEQVFSHIAYFTTFCDLDTWLHAGA